MSLSNTCMITIEECGVEKMDSYYDILGVPKNASQKEMRQAYRKLARQYHPDVNPEKKDAEEKFKRINAAYEVLSNPDTRRKYDRYGSNWKHADQMPPRQQESRDFSGAGSWQRFSGEGPAASLFDLGDLSDQLFSTFRRSRQRSTVTIPVEVTLEEAYKGATRLIEIPADVSGASPRRFEVKIPPGVDNGSKVRVSTSQENLPEVQLKVSVRPHSRIQRKGADLYTDISVPLADAILGGEVTVPTLNGQVVLRLKPETQNQQRIRLAKKGMPHLNNPDVKGHLYAKVEVVLPKGLSEREREIFEELRELGASAE